MFKNASFLRLPDGFRMPVDVQLTEIRSPGPLEMETRGFVPPISDSPYYLHQCGPAWLMGIATDRRILPTAVLRDEVEKRCRDLWRATAACD